MSKLQAIIICALVTIYLTQSITACRVGSEKLKSLTRKHIEHLLDVQLMSSIYWDEEPLNANAIAKATGINVTSAHTQFSVHDGDVKQPVEFLRDMFVTCSADKDRSYTLTINLEFNNPFKVIELHFNHWTKQKANIKGKFRVRLPQSSFLVQLNQRISYDECFVVDYVQLAPNVMYEVECVDCDETQKEYLDRIFSKRMSQLDAELDAKLSEKLLLGLQVLLSEQRLDLDLYGS